MALSRQILAVLLVAVTATVLILSLVVGCAATGSAESTIRDIDFENGFVYDDPSAIGIGEGSIVVTDGLFVNGEFGDPDYMWFDVMQVKYGDLTGDGVEEAVVSWAYNTGGTGIFQSVQAFQLVDDDAVDAGVVPFGDRAHGGFFDFMVADGLVSVLTYIDGDGACCPTEAAVVRLAMGDHFLVHADMTDALAMVSTGNPASGPELKFLPGTSAGYVLVRAMETQAQFTVEAAEKQRLTIDVVNGPSPEKWSIVNAATGEVVTAADSAVVPASAVYTVQLDFEADRGDSSVIEVGIDQPTSTVSWVPAVEQVVVSQDPDVRTSVSWPVFATELNDQSKVAAANQAIVDRVSRLDDAWIEAVTEFPPAEGVSTYEVSYHVTYASADLVSVRLDYYDYICCQPYPNYGPRAVVLDLATGHIVEPDDILALSRLDEIRDVWLGEIQARALLPDEMIESQRSTLPTFDSIGLADGGIEFGTARGALGGGSPGTTVVVSFDALGDLVQPDLRARLNA